MSNSLVKDTNFIVNGALADIPGTPFVPGIPARTVSETKMVCGFRYAGVPGRYVYDTDPATGTTRMTFVPNVPGSIGGSTQGVYSCQMETVPVNYPATPPVYGVPAHQADYQSIVPGFNLGWNSGGRSIAVITNNGYAEFKVRASVVGVICGLNLYDGINAHYNGMTTDYAFYLTRGIARIMENGVIVASSVGTYTDATVFRITRSGTTITYAMNGSTVKTTTGAATTPFWLEASQYSAGDEVFDPAMTQVSSPDLTSIGSVMAIVLPPMDMLMSDYAYGELDLTLPMFESGLEAGLAEPSYALLSIELPPLAFNANSLTGEIAQMALTLPPMEALLADHPYGEMRIVLPPMGAYLDATEGPTHASMASNGDASSRMVPRTLLFVSMNSKGTAVSTLVARINIPVEMFSTGLANSIWSLKSLQHALMMSIATASGLANIPGEDVQTWVINLEGNGSTNYDNFGFNSFARIGDRFYGAKAGGIYRLEGDDDAGQAIRAAIGLGKKDFGSSVNKTVSECFIGLSSQGNIFVKLIVEGEEFLYKTTNSNTEIQQQRVKFGKGLKANYTGIEIYNEDGEDFEIDTVEFMVADLSRKL